MTTALTTGRHGWIHGTRQTKAGMVDTENAETESKATQEPRDINPKLSPALTD